MAIYKNLQKKVSVVNLIPYTKNSSQTSQSLKSEIAHLTVKIGLTKTSQNLYLKLNIQSPQPIQYPTITKILSNHTQARSSLLVPKVQ